MKFLALAALSPVIAPFLATEAVALNARTWISGKGADTAGCGPIASPCRTLQYAHDQTSPGGEIDVLDPAGYGSLIITKAINVINEGGVAGVLAGAGGTALAVNAGANDKVVLRGLTVEGANVASYGIVFNSGGSLLISNCFVQGFVATSGQPDTGSGIYIKHTSGTPVVTVSNTIATNNEYIGMRYVPGGSGGGQFNVIGSQAIGNGYGITFNAAFSTNANIKGSVTNSAAISNQFYGIQIRGKTSADGIVVALLGNSVVGNTIGVYLDGRVYGQWDRNQFVSSTTYDAQAADPSTVFVNTWKSNVIPSSPTQIPFASSNPY